MADLLTPEQQQTVDSVLPALKVKMLARQIHGNEHLEQILSQADPKLRRAVYAKIKPHLRFKPKPFYLFKFNATQTY